MTPYLPPHGRRDVAAAIGRESGGERAPLQQPPPDEYQQGNLYWADPVQVLAGRGDGTGRDVVVPAAMEPCHATIGPLRIAVPDGGEIVRPRLRLVRGFPLPPPS